MEQLNPKTPDELKQEQAEQEFLEGGSTKTVPKGHTH
jgi:hypothetical protein